MKGVAILAFFCASLALASAGNIVCYFFSWTVYRTGDGKFEAALVDPNLCTHLIYAYVGLNENGTVYVLDNWEVTSLDEVEHLMSLKEQNSDLKILVSLGGYGEGSETYSEVAADPDKRAVLVDSVISFIDEYQFDGLDLDWEYPGQRGGDEVNDQANYITLLEELSAALSNNSYIFSVGVTGNVYLVDTSYPDGKAITDVVDMINVNAFDFHGSWEDFVGHNAPLYVSHLDETVAQQQLNVAAGIQHWIDIGADPKKINIGIKSSGRSFTLADPSNAELYAPVNGTGEPGPYTQESGTLGYNEICSLDSDDWEYVWDDEQMVPHIVNGDQWVGYDNVESIQQKIQFANELGLGGASIWGLDTDDFLGSCGDGKYPLLQAINDNLD